MILTDRETDFLKESNAIEREYSDEAMEDAIEAWRYAKNFLPDNRKIDIPMIKTVHKFLMKRLDSRIAGNIREVDVWVGDRKCLEPKEIEISLRDWLPECNFIKDSKVDVDEELIKNCHVWFEKIHPFEDGNGRTGRILMNLQRLRNGMDILVIHKGNEQFEYYKWFKDAKCVLDESGGKK